MPRERPPASPPGVRIRARELRHAETPAEHKLWQRLRDQQLAGYKFRRQHPIGSFVVDFYCPAARLVVEVDGESHLAQAEFDARRTEWLQQYGYRILRVTNSEVYTEIEGVLTAILAACQEASAG